MSAEHEKGIAGASYVQFLSLSHFVSFHLAGSSERALMRRMKWLGEALEAKTVFPTGTNQWFLEATTGDAWKDSRGRVFSGTCDNEPPDCRIDRLQLLKSHRVEQDLPENPNKLFFIDEFDADEIYAASCRPRGPDMYIIHGYDKIYKDDMPSNRVLLDKDLG